MQNISSGTVIRTLCLLVALINQALSVFGKSPLPIEDETITTAVSTGITIATAVAAWWKNNSFTKAAIEADQVLRAGSVSDAASDTGGHRMNSDDSYDASSNHQLNRIDSGDENMP